MKTVLIIAAFATCASGTAVLEKNKVTFERREQNLNWPLPDLFDAGQVIYHGVHCFMEMQDFKKSDEPSKQHRHHCRHSIAKALRLLESDPSHHRADAWVCQLLEENRRLAKAHYQTFDVFDYYQVPEPAPPDFFRSDANAVSKAKQEIRRDPNPIAPAKDQYHAYVILATQNFGELLTKNASNPSSLNDAEREYLRQLEGDHANGFQALGVYCRVDGKIEEIRKAISESEKREKQLGALQGPPKK